MQECILKYLKGKTRILITHAQQYLKFMDQILYMKKGMIIWKGTYDELKDQDFFIEYKSNIKHMEEEESEKMRKKQEKNSEIKKDLNSINIVPANDKIEYIAK